MRLKCLVVSIRCWNLLLLAALLAIGGCGRKQYREHADREVYATIGGKTQGTPWEVDRKFSIEPEPASRLTDPSDPDFPVLPDPGPALHSYDLPVAAKTTLEAPREIGVGSETAEDVETLPIQPIPAEYWEAVPRPCLTRMLEFHSVWEEYSKEYKKDPPAEYRDASPRLTFADVVRLAMVNSREFQSQKEQLYRAALALTLERFAYSPKLSERGNGADGDYVINRDVNSGYTETSTISPGLQADALLATGGTVLARFANNVVFTFDGPDGFSKDVSSEVFFGFTQSIFQRDLRLNPLIQSERSLVYAARDYTRFRREFFVQIAQQYYGLLRDYRSIEIESQNYFSLVRTFQQAEAEVRTGVEDAPNPVAVDQFEQGMLSGRSDLISACNRLERGLDALKLLLGLPTEQPINLDLGELDRLTLRDQVEVAGERVRRWLGRVIDRRSQPSPDRAEILNGDIYLIRRLLEWLRLRAMLEQDLPETSRLERSLGGFRVDFARIEAERIRALLDRLVGPDRRAPIILQYQRTSDHVDVLEILVARQIEYAEILGRDAEEIKKHRQALTELEKRSAALRDRLEAILNDPNQQQLLEGLVADVTTLRADIENLVATLDGLLAIEDAPQDEAAKLAKTLSETDTLVEIVRGIVDAAPAGLPVLGINVDDAMGTALVQRLDLMNERGLLADDRRNIKLAADDLKTILDLDASQSIRTRDNKPFKFSKKNSTTRVSVSVDLPFNRREQRNSYRRALIEYQAGRRSLMALEDSIKFDVRDGLRTLEETRIQYPISVTQAALAAEQVLSVRLQLALGVQGVRGTDLLDALQSSRRALIDVANSRIGYIVDRAQFVLDLELMELDTAGAWPFINHTEYRPVPNLVYPANAGPAYGTIPRFLWVSREIREMLNRPPPGEVAPVEEEEGAAVGGK